MAREKIQQREVLMNKVKIVLLMASMVLAAIFTFSCSSDESGGEVGSSSSTEGGTQGNVSSSSDGGQGGGSSSSEGTQGDVSSSSSGSEGGSKITKSKISGVSQKGPFVEGSTATLYELNDEFTQTGRSFRDIIADNKGSFEIRGVELISPYAMLEASGYYRNEVTGEVSKGPITLFAIADIREKDNVNVNLLTHLEYYRVLNLVEDGKSVAEAKNQAQKEILAVFGINGDFENSEDMTIFGTTEGDAVLLAISILLQGNLGEGEFSQRLTNFAQSVRISGKWENETAKAAIADWAYTADLAGIRSNITGWGLSSEVPDFEKCVTDYWATAYGLGGCGSANEGEVKKDNRDIYRICKTGNWAVASILEYDTYQWVCSDVNIGEIKAGRVSNKEYVCKYDVWREASYKDKYCFENKNKCKYFTDTRDNQRYTYVVIGEQTWMAENLNYNGSLYYWATAMDLPSSCNSSSCSSQIQPKHRGICPSGWHLPTKAEWDVLTAYVGDEGKKLRATSGWNEEQGKFGGTDEYGFSALPDSNDGFGKSGWWCASQSGDYNAYARLYHGGYAFWNGDTKSSDLHSVRCLQD